MMPTVNDTALVDLLDTGIADVTGLSRLAAMDLLYDLEGRTKYAGHVKGSSVAAYPSGSSSCWAMDDVLRAPHLFELALSLTDLVEAYLEQPPLMYSVNAFTTYPMEGPLNPDIQEYHRDRDDVKFVALFVYLTDVLTESQGPHQYQEGTQEGSLGDGVSVTVLGPAGTAFLADTRGLHRGLRPSHVTRSMAWVRWGVSDPPASYVWDNVSPASKDVLGGRYPEDVKLQQSIRLVVR